MKSSLRGLATVGLLILLAGCQQGKQPGGRQGAAPNEAPGRQAGSKTGGSSSRSGEAVAAPGAAGMAVRGSQSPGKISTLTAADDGRSFELKQGQVVTVVLDSNRSNGFSWAMAAPAGTVVVRDGAPVYTTKAGKRGQAGASGTETWRFRAVQSGRQTVRLEYARPWSRNVPEGTFRFTVTVR